MFFRRLWPIAGITWVILFSSAACLDGPASGDDPPGLNDPPASRPTTTSAPAERPRTTERAADRRIMVERQIAARGVRDPAVLAAMRDVPRHWFVPQRLAHRAYDDGPLPIGYDQTISQPYIVALMTEALELKRGDKVLEIGTGSGYQAAVLSELTDEVYSIEIVRPLGERAQKVFDRRGYTTIRTRIGDGYQGWPQAAPFDAVIVTCAPESPPPALVEQLKPGGRMVIPVGGSPMNQVLIRLTKLKDGTLNRETIAPVAFVPMTGEAQRRR